MRQKSKQQAKIEATQKLEQVKNEQQQLQQQQLQQQFGDDTPNSPSTPQPNNGESTPPQQPNKDNFVRPQLPGTPNSTSPSDDVFLRPQLPPPSAAAKPFTQDTQFSQGSSSQPKSPQMFSPGSSGSRPSSPLDPYAKMAGTPRPQPSGSSTPRRGSISDVQVRGRPSPAHEPFGSPTSASIDMYSKPPDTPRPSDPFVKPLGPSRTGPLADQQQPQQQQSRHILPSATSGDNFTRLNNRPEQYQQMSSRVGFLDSYPRPPIAVNNESGSAALFKTPMPPSQDLFNTAQPGMRRGSTDGFSQAQQSDPYLHQPLTPHPSLGDAHHNDVRLKRQSSGGHFVQPLPMARHPQRDSYVQAPSTPRPDYSQQMDDSYAHALGTTRSHDPYAHLPGTPRPHSDSFLVPSSTPQGAQTEPFSYSQSSFRHSPAHSMDPYAQMPGTPRPTTGERYPKSPAQRSADVYMQAASTPRPVKLDPYSQAPGTPRPVFNDPYAQPPGTPRPGPMVNSSDQVNHPQNRIHGSFAHAAGPGFPTQKNLGVPDENSSLHHPSPNQTPVHDPFEQAPLTPCSQSIERTASGGSSNTSNSSVIQDNMQTTPLDSEDKLNKVCIYKEAICFLFS